MGFLKKLKQKFHAQGSQKCKCGDLATRTMMGKDGRELNLCSECHAIMHLAMMVERNLFEKSLLENAFSERKAGDFRGALISFEIMTGKIEKLIKDYYSRMISPFESEEEKKITRTLLLDFLDVCAYVHQQAGLSAYNISQAAPLRFETPIDIVAIEHLLKATQNKVPYKYMTSQEIKYAPGTSKKDLPLCDIPSPVDVIKACEISPIIDFEKLKIELISSGFKELILVANITRCFNDLIWFAECYTVLGKSFLHYGSYPRQMFFGLDESDTKRRAEMITKLTPTSALSFAIQVLGLARDCIEKLPVLEETFKLRTAYGTTLFDEGMCFYRQKLYNEAKERLMKALRIYKNKEKWPPPKNTELGTADCYLYLGECEAALKNYGQAESYLAESLKISDKLGIKDNVERAKRLIEELRRNPT